MNGAMVRNFESECVNCTFVSSNNVFLLGKIILDFSFVGNVSGYQLLSKFDGECTVKFIWVVEQWVKNQQRMLKLLTNLRLQEN